MEVSEAVPPPLPVAGLRVTQRVADPIVTKHCVLFPPLPPVAPLLLSPLEPDVVVLTK
jgi:hypothetical protein